MKKTKFLKLVGLCSLSLLTLTGCGMQEQYDEQGNLIVQMSLMNSKNENPGWFAMIDAANEVLAAKGEKIKIEAEIIKTISWDEYYQSITTNILGGLGGTIGRIAESHVPLMIERGQIGDLTSVVNELQATGEFEQGVFGGVAKKDDKYYGLPTGTQHMVLYYNKTIFDDYNRTHPEDQISYPSSDWSNASTFAEIRETARKLTSGSGSNKKFGISAGPFLSYAGMYSLNSGGVNIFDENGNCCIDSQPFYDVYNWFEGLLVQDKSAPSTADTALLDSVGRFEGGNVAMLIDGVWQIHDICKYTEDYEIGIAAIPVLSSQYKSYTTTFSDCFWASSNSPHPEADRKALKALMSEEAINALCSKTVGGIPVRSKCIKTFTDSLTETKLSTYANVIAEGIKNKAYVPYSTYYNQVDQRINQKMAVWIEGKMSTVDFVKYMDSTMKEGMAGKL